jgi:type IV conjugative transfer system protein TraE
MFFNKFVSDRGQAVALANRLMVVVLVMLGMLVFTTYHAVLNKTVITIVPAKLDKRVQLAYNSADKDYHIRYALYVAYLFGNVTPSTVNTSVKAMEYIFTPELFHDVHQEIIAQAEQLERSGNTISFNAKNFLYEQSTNLVFVTGEQIIRSPSGVTRSKLVTFELSIRIHDYVPSITHFSLYDDVAHTLEWRKQHANKLPSSS